MLPAFSLGLLSARGVASLRRIRAQGFFVEVHAFSTQASTMHPASPPPPPAITERPGPSPGTPKPETLNPKPYTVNPKPCPHM